MILTVVIIINTYFFTTSNQLTTFIFSTYSRHICFCIPIRSHFIYEPNSQGDERPMGGLSGVAKIRPVVNEETLFNNVVMGEHMYELEFPSGADPDSKMQLLGALFVLNEVIVKEHKNARDDGNPMNDLTYASMTM